LRAPRSFTAEGIIEAVTNIKFEVFPDHVEGRDASAFERLGVRFIASSVLQKVDSATRVDSRLLSGEFAGNTDWPRIVSTKLQPLVVLVSEELPAGSTKGIYAG